MKIPKTLDLLSFGFALNSCIKQPEACLTADKYTASVNEAITISSCSKEAARFSWTSDKATIVSGGDFCSSSIVLKYSSPGTYNVNLEVSNYRGKSDCNSTGTNKSDDATISITVK